VDFSPGCRHAIARGTRNFHRIPGPETWPHPCTYDIGMVEAHRNRVLVVDDERLMRWSLS